MAPRHAIIATGLLRYGLVEQAQRISTALFEAAEYSEGRLPELFCGFIREQFDEPIPYPPVRSPQACGATTPIQVVKTLMGYCADVARGGLWLDPLLPKSYGDLHIANAPIQGLPDAMQFLHGIRPWASDLAERAKTRKTP